MARMPSSPPEASHLPSPEWNRALAKALLTWFRKHRRDLPWRNGSDPYRIWVSEIMLQQTQVVTVIPYFQRFLAAFPTVGHLAAADEHQVLKLWEGLGYYRRARQLHAAAKVVATQHGGLFPDSFESIRQLPGIGRYTAGAIASIAYDQPAPILEANTIRLLARLFAVPGDPTTTATQRQLWQLAEAILPERNCGTFNQALMEVGSLVCTPRAPRCGECPLSELCAAFQRGLQDEIPGAKPRVNFESVREAALVVWHRGKVFLRQRGAGERWAGLWDFVRFPLVAKRGAALERELIAKTREQAGLAIESPEPFATLKHGVTRFRITLQCYQAQCATPRGAAGETETRWIKPAGLADMPLSTTGRKLSRLISEQKA